MAREFRMAPLRLASASRLKNARGLSRRCNQERGQMRVGIISEISRMRLDGHERFVQIPDRASGFARAARIAGQLTRVFASTTVSKSAQSCVNFSRFVFSGKSRRGPSRFRAPRARSEIGPVSGAATTGAVPSFV